MTPLVAAHPLLHALGWTLIHFCWQGLLTAAMLWCVLSVLELRSSQARYGAACFALVLMVAMPVLTFAHIAAADLRNAAPWNSTLTIDASLQLQAVADDFSAPWPMRIALALDRSMPWLLLAWLAGAIFFAVRLNLGLIVARRLKSAGTECPSAELLCLFDSLRRQLGVDRAVRLLHSARVQVPTVIGWLRPAVLIPASCLSGLSTVQIEAIFCHELAHVRRHDYLVSVLQSVAEALLFYHPAIWWVSKQVRRERECCCDEIAVTNGGDALAYAKALSYLEERRAAFPEFVLGANGGVLTMRIKRLLGCTEAEPSQFGALTLLALVLAVLGSYAVSVAKAQPKSDARASAALTAPPVSGAVDAQVDEQPNLRSHPMKPQYKLWLTQDVVYIITPAEREAYLRLTNDEERDDFIASFWERRNPPGAAPDTFRQEHYSRIAYSNQHFASNHPGWKSDRGHVYIVYGKPQSVDSHPDGGGPSGYPFETWHYAHISGVGDNVDLSFVDTCACGQYKLTADRLDQGPAAADTSKSRFALAARRLNPGAATSAAVAPASPAATAEGAIAGIIVDPTGALVPRASVGAVKSDGSVSLVKRTDNSGRYTLAPLPPGRYNVEVHAAGFKQLMQQNVQVEPQQQVALNLRLRVGEVNQSLTVTGKPLAAALNPPPPQTFDTPPAPPNTNRPLRISSGVAAGMAISQPPPAYPEEAKIAHVDGVVVLKAIISKAGAVQDLSVVSGPTMLIASALDAVKQWRFKPYLLNGEPTEVQTTISVNYTFGPDPADPSSAPPAQTKDIGMLSSADVPEKMSDGATPPKVIYQVEPAYTAAARKAKISGTVLVNLNVDEQGNPQDVHVVRGLDNGLDQRAVEAVKQYRFKPAIKDDKPVEEALNIEINFQIF